MKLNLVIEKNCSLCARVQSDLERIVSNHKDLSLAIYDIEKQNGFNVQIVPSLFIEKELFAIGDFDMKKLMLALV